MRKGNGNGDFPAGIGCLSMEGAELKALKAGLELAWERRIDKIIVETDSKTIIRWLGEDEEGHLYAEEIEACKRLVRMPWTCRIEYVSREANGVADCLAKMGHHRNGHLEFFYDPPLEVVSFLM